MAGWLPLLVQSTDPVGPAGWSVRNWLGLGCQVVVFILLVAFIFYLAGLGEDEEGAPAGDASAPADSGQAPESEPASEDPKAEA